MSECKYCGAKIARATVCISCKSAMRKKRESRDMYYQKAHVLKMYGYKVKSYDEAMELSERLEDDGK